MNEKITVIIPAYNEAENIGPLLDSLQKIKKQGLIHEIIVINDGSTDSTAEIAEAKCVDVLSLRRNYGKAFAFYTGARRAEKLGTDILITLDSDLKPVSGEQIERLVRWFKKRKDKMNIGEVAGMGAAVNLSGQRIIQMKALKPLLRGNPKWEQYFGIRGGKFYRRTGYGLEEALNKLLLRRVLPIYAHTTNTAFQTARTRRATWETMGRETEIPFRIIEKRRALARRIKQLRKNKKTNELAKIKERLKRRKPAGSAK